MGTEPEVEQLGLAGWFPVSVSPVVTVCASGADPVAWWHRSRAVASYEHDLRWLSGVIDKHYAGDDSDVKVLMGGILALRLLIVHDDVHREFDYTTGAEVALDTARSSGWTMVSMKDDWARVYGAVP